jgi:hypothetical protein
MVEGIQVGDFEAVTIDLEVVVSTHPRPILMG